jgi:nicotinamidase-related amidase
MRGMNAFTLHAHRTAVLLIDFQIRLFQAMDETISFRHAKNAEHMVFAAGAFELPLLVTEQKNMGPTMPSLEVPEDAQRFPDKTSFSCMKHEGFERALRKTGCDQVIVSGMETHVCVAQTVRDLRSAGFDVVVVADACLSRRRLDYRLGLTRMKNDGAHVWTAEAVLFELQGCFEGPRAKEISRRIR